MVQKQVEEKKRDIKLLCPNPCLMTTSEGHRDTVAEPSPARRCRHQGRLPESSGMRLVFACTEACEPPPRKRRVAAAARGILVPKNVLPLRLHLIFFITPEGEYYACILRARRRCGGVLSCCGPSVQKPGCQPSEYHCFRIGRLVLTKVSVASWRITTSYEAYVRPSSPILDYNTAFLRITAELLRNGETTLQDLATAMLCPLSACAVQVGNGLENDLRVLRLLLDTAVDTAAVFPRDRSLSLRRPLRSLVGAYLKHYDARHTSAVSVACA
ncbi:hypothetical protein HPB48_026201 [Haemaphysalis longicornis]|uniref:Uncharacterized protein n=1 Tax=Haemaphysalis longicornis TaxID=44386 RepID=A0A9J6HBH7_HAELO|nr:hypothetical protein HPB48_026201 [Haemaphysalis longicornis]